MWNGGIVKICLYSAPRSHSFRTPRLRRELASTSAARMAVVHPRFYLQAVGVVKELQRQLALLREKEPGSGRQ